jgi:hypothetical protein
VCCSRVSPVAAFVENLVCAKKCSLWVKLPGETIELEFCVCVARIAREKTGLDWF